MDAKTIVIILLILYICVALWLRKMDIFAAYVFFVPFQLVKWDVGVTMYASQLILIFGAVYTAFKVGLRSFYNAENPVLAAYLIVAVVCTVVMFFFAPKFESSDGFFRQEGRILGQVALLVVSYMFVVGLAKEYISRPVDLITHINAYVSALCVLVFLGLVQALVFKASGVDIFPLRQEGDDVISGIYSFEGQQVLRINSLGGEPKTLAVSLVFGFFAITVSNSFGFFYSRVDAFLKYIFLIAAFATFSTGGMLVFLILFAVNKIVRIGRRFVVQRHARISFVDIFMTVLALVIGYKYSGALLFLFEDRISSRELFSEDFDKVIQIFLSENPEFFFFGVGVGNIHNFAAGYIPAEFSHYMAGNIFTAKSGYLKIISESGVVGLAMFIGYNYFSFSRVRKVLRRSQWLESRIFSWLLTLFLLSLVAFMARVSMFYNYLVFFSLLNAIAYWPQRFRAKVRVNV